MDLPIEPTKPKTQEEIVRENPHATHEMFLKEEQIVEFERLLHIGAGETTLDKFLAKNPAIFSAMLHHFHTGHHGMVVVAKQDIRPHIKTETTKGLIPDFIVGGDSSDGWQYWVIELKGSDQTLFSQTGLDTYFNTEINKGICQLLEYIDFCNEHQSTLREVFKFEQFREPNGMLIAGRSAELEATPEKKKLKAAWNRLVSPKMEIRTFDFMARVLRPLFELRNRSNGS